MGGFMLATMKRTKILNIIQILAVGVLLISSSGCSQQDSVSPVSTQQKNITPQPDIPPVTLNAQENGNILSKELIQIQGQTPSVNIYKLFYISEGVKVEAYLSEPKASGKHPLLVILHGGWTGPQPSQFHDRSVGFQSESLKYSKDNMIIIESNYRGYMDSEGSVQGLDGNTKDIQNVIKAAISLGNVKPESIYLLGYSMGGGVALRVASERNDVKAVVAVSSFVGWDEIIHWMDNHPNENSTDIITKERVLANYWKTFFKNHPGTERENSLLDRIKDIQAPVFFLQGTGDQNVVWQTVEDFAEIMKSANKKIKFNLYPDGQHGLRDQYQNESIKEIDNWFKEYGLSFPFQRPPT
jgi:dipeptidyl aminopeptidase/acylaminoacyl peptidase